MSARVMVPASFALNVLLVLIVVWLVIPDGGSFEAQADDDERPMKGAIQLFTLEYHLYPDVEPSARNSADEAFFPISDLERRPFVPSGDANDPMTATGACVILQTHIHLPSQSSAPFYNSSYEDVTCDANPGVSPIEAIDFLGTRIGVIFSLDATHAQVSGDAYVLPYTAGKSNEFPSFRGSMPLMYAVPEHRDGGVSHGDLRYDTVPFEGSVVLTYYGLIDWQRGSLG